MDQQSQGIFEWVKRRKIVTGVLVVTPIPIGIAYPMSTPAVIVRGMVLGLAPAYVAILVTIDPNTVIAVKIATFISVCDGGCWCKDRQSQGYPDSEQHGFRSF